MSLVLNVKYNKLIMKSKTRILFLLSFIVFSLSYSQNNIFYQFKKGGSLKTEAEYQKMKKDFFEKMQKDSPNGKLNEEITDSIAGNTIYKKYSLSFVSESSNEENAIKSYIGKKFPDFIFETLDGKQLKLEDFKGKPTFITFWFTTCAPCVLEIPELQRLKDKYSDRVNFIAITFNNKDIVNKFLGKKKFDYLHLVNAIKFTTQIGQNTYPRNVFIDKNGLIDDIKEGIDYEEKDKNITFDSVEFEEKLERLLSQNYSNVNVSEK